MPKSNARNFNNKSLERALGILYSFDLDRQEQTLTELSKSQKLPKSTTHRLVSTLVNFDALQYDRASGKYSLGLGVFRIGAIAYHSFPIKKIAATYLSQLHSKLNKTVALAVLRDDQVVYVDKREDWTSPIRIELGRRRPAHFGMFGQLLMAYLPELDVERLLKKSPPVAYTKNSITSVRAFKARLKTIRQQGYAVDNGEVCDGLFGIAAPIRDSSGEVVASLGVSLITAAGDAASVNNIIREVCKTSRLISIELSSVKITDGSTRHRGKLVKSP